MSERKFYQKPEFWVGAAIGTVTVGIAIRDHFDKEAEAKPQGPMQLVHIPTNHDTLEVSMYAGYVPGKDDPLYLSSAAWQMEGVEAGGEWADINEPAVCQALSDKGLIYQSDQNACSDAFIGGDDIVRVRDGFLDGTPQGEPFNRSDGHVVGLSTTSIPMVREADGRWGVQIGQSLVDPYELTAVVDSPLNTQNVAATGFNGELANQAILTVFTVAGLAVAGFYGNKVLNGIGDWHQQRVENRKK